MGVLCRKTPMQRLHPNLSVQCCQIQSLFTEKYKDHFILTPQSSPNIERRLARKLREPAIDSPYAVNVRVLLGYSILRPEQSVSNTAELENTHGICSVSSHYCHNIWNWAGIFTAWLFFKYSGDA